MIIFHMSVLRTQVIPCGYNVNAQTLFDSSGKSSKI